MSPIFVRPVREQLEHDRLIRHLQLKYKRKFEVALNVGDEQVAPVKIGALTLYPDLVLTAGRKLAGVVEVESAESVNNLEAMAQWVHFARARVPFHLYVPVTGYETARRLCDANHATVTEIWTYRAAVDGFDLVRMSNDTAIRTARISESPFPPRPTASSVKVARPGPLTSPAPKAEAKAPPARGKAATGGPKSQPARRSIVKKPTKPSKKPSSPARGKSRATASRKRS